VARTRLSPHLRRVLYGLVLVLVVEYLVIPQIAGARRNLGLLSGVKLQYLLIGVGLEFLAIAAYAQLTRSILKREHAPSFWTLLRIQLATLSLSHVIPGGPAAGSGLGYRLLTKAGLDGHEAGFALATQSVGSAVVLNLMLWIGLLVSIPLRGFNPLYLTAAIIGVLLIGAFSLAVLALTRGEAHAARFLRALARRIPILDEDKLHDLVHRTADRLRTIARDRRLLMRLIGWAAANWLLDAASLWVFLLAFGHRAGVDALLVSYGLANVLAAIPITPGGLGVVEAVLAASLVGFGASRGEAVLGVIAWRLVNFWLPIPVGAGTYLSLRFEPRGARARELRRVAEEAAKEAEDLKSWSDKHGVKLPHPHRHHP
jgi:uncharacterized protein (TIRG00374 family)